VAGGWPWLRQGLAGLVRGAGPELISAASDNDPTNVGTAASVGAHAGYQLAWVALLAAPLLGVVQAIAASVAGGLATPLGMALLVRLARGPAVMGTRPISPGLAAAGWTAVAIVGGLGLLVIAGAATAIH
jgi:Mn2+/Fe2+ NRAMP family transporter